MQQHILIIGMVWPEPTTTAAGVRMLGLIELFQRENYRITFVSTAKRSSYSYPLEELCIATHTVVLNDASFDTLLLELSPQLVLFDRFITQEQFGWRVAQVLPNAVRILNTEDLHSLRQSRYDALQSNKQHTLFDWKTHPNCLREVASIYQCDITLVISKYEYTILIEQIGIPKELILYLPFLLDRKQHKDIQQLNEFHDRKHFVTIGNYKHLPNWKSLLYIKEKIWPLIREKDKTVAFHYYGAYQEDKVRNLHNEKEHFIYKGHCINAQEMLKSSRVCLAPLSFGAGLKGKFFDALLAGTPSITTPIGAEGIATSQDWSGYITEEPQDIAQKALLLYHNVSLWKEAQAKREHILASFYSLDFQEEFLRILVQLQQQNTLQVHRSNNIVGRILLQNQYSTSKYLSKWIALKNNR